MLKRLSITFIFNLLFSLTNHYYKHTLNLIMLCKRGVTMKTFCYEKFDNKHFTYSTLGKSTSVHSHTKRIKDYKIPKYKIREKLSGKFFAIKNKMRHYFKDNNSYFPIPGLSVTNVLGDTCNTMVPQGICVCEEYVLITAYDSLKEYNSVIYVLTNHKLITTLIYDKKTHMGGICYDGTYIWIAEGGNSEHGNEISYIKKEDFFNTINASIELKAKSIGLHGITPLRAKELNYTSFCSFYDNLLWIGTFSTNDTSHIYGYSIINKNNQLSLMPVQYIEAPPKSQGICFYKDNDTTYLCVSTSYGRRHNSVFRCYKLLDYNKQTENHNGINQIFKGNAYKTLILPSMSEQINITKDSIYCIFESGATKYVRTSSRPIGSYCIFDANKIF